MGDYLFRYILRGGLLRAEYRPYPDDIDALESAWTLSSESDIMVWADDRYVARVKRNAASSTAGDTYPGGRVSLLLAPALDGCDYSEFLEALGVEGVKTFRNRNAANLATRMNQMNAAKKITRILPNEKVVTGGIEQQNNLIPGSPTEQSQFQE